ncbi:MAG TPA: PilZ domain-containing protein [Candidatus Sulfotelmatobacter sp.]|jgi:hypothetical protein|nr:PilZ domain-containing protein [Candidatus Sulfotelmatobacter sp.]
MLSIVPTYGLLAVGRSMHAERRFKSRYPMDLNVRFRCLSGSFFSGEGQALNLSSGGILVASPKPVTKDEITVGALLEMRIEWPSLLDGKVPLQLIAVGRVVRRRAAGFAATFEQYKFRTVSAIQPSLNLQ